MSIYIKHVLLIAMLTTLLACSKNAEEERLEGVALSKDDGESVLAESLFCAGTASALNDLSNEDYKLLAESRNAIEKIAKMANDEVNTLRGNDGVAIDTRLSVIKTQTEENLGNFADNNENEKLTEFVEKVIAQCTRFAI